MERKQLYISLPATFTCTMTPQEATRRSKMADKIDGVSFEITGTTPDGRIEGCTIVTSIKALEKFNERLNPPIIKLKKASAR